MKIYDLRDEAGRVFAFEVGNTFFSRKAACLVVRSIPGVRILRLPKWFSSLREEVFCEFELAGERFKILEPYGDNSMYWIGPEGGYFCHSDHLGTVREAFLRAGRSGRVRRNG